MIFSRREVNKGGLAGILLTSLAKVFGGLGGLLHSGCGLAGSDYEGVRFKQGDIKAPRWVSEFVAEHGDPLAYLAHEPGSHAHYVNFFTPFTRGELMGGASQDTPFEEFLQNTQFYSDDLVTNQLAMMLVIKYAHAEMLAHYGHNKDGTRNEEGHNISFLSPFQIDSFPIERLNVMCLKNGYNPALLGWAHVDVGNRYVNHECRPNSGVFLDSVMQHQIHIQPEFWVEGLTSADQGFLYELLYDKNGTTGLRRDVIRQYAKHIGTAIANITSHEIAHNIGLKHEAAESLPSGVHNLMYYARAQMVGPERFSNEGEATLRTNLRYVA